MPLSGTGFFGMILFLLFQIGRCMGPVQQCTFIETHPDRY